MVGMIVLYLIYVCRLCEKIVYIGSGRPVENSYEEIEPVFFVNDCSVGIDDLFS